MILAIHSEKLGKKESYEMIDRNLGVKDKNWAECQQIKLQKMQSMPSKAASTEVSVPKKEHKCLIHGSGEITLGQHSSSPGHCTKTGTAHHYSDSGNVEWPSALYGKTSHSKTLLR